MKIAVQTFGVRRHEAAFTHEHGGLELCSATFAENPTCPSLRRARSKMAPVGRVGGHSPLGHHPSKAFSLMELLAVMAIVGVLFALMIPAVNSISGGASVTQSGQVINDQLSLARQLAVGRNLNVEIRFIQEEEGEGSGVFYEALQLWELDRSGGNPQPLGRLVRLPGSTVVNGNLSPLLTPAGGTSAKFASLGERPYTALRFRPNGRMAAQQPMDQSVLTTQLRREDPDDPDNYFTLQINPLTGRITAYRP